MDISIRHAEPNDKDKILEIKYRGWLFAYSHIFKAENIEAHFSKKFSNAEYHKEQLDIINTNPHNYVAVCENEVVATMTIKPIVQEEDFIEVLCLYVHPNKNKLGIGTKLFEFATQIAKDNNKSKIHIEALKENHIGCAFYQKQGGKPFDSRLRECCGVNAEMITFEFDVK